MHIKLTILKGVDQRPDEDKKTHRMRMIETCKKFVDDPEIPTYNKIEARIGLAMAQMELYGPEKYLDETKRTFYVVTEELGGLKKKYFQDPKWAGPIKHLEDLMGSVVMAILVESQNVKKENVAQENSEASQESPGL